MTRRMTRMVTMLVCALPAMAAGRLPAQDPHWAEKLFDKTEHDFGVVARNAEVRWRFTITNRLKEPLHIASVGTICTCYTAKVSRQTLAPRESAELEVRLDTQKFKDARDSQIIVRFDAPRPAEVRIPVRAFIRGDVLLSPGGAEFGAVPRGSRAERKISVTLLGRDSWRIDQAACRNPHVETRLVETARLPGQVTYDLFVGISREAPLGDLREQVTLVTNDPAHPHLPVLVDARIEPEFFVSPQIVDFGVLPPGAELTKTIVVRGRRPFRVTKIESEKTAGTFQVRLPREARAMHALPLSVAAPREPGVVTETFTVTLDESDEPITFKAYLRVDARSSPLP